MSLERPCGEQIVWRRVRGFADLGRLRNAICGLLFDCAAQTVVSVLSFVDELCGAPEADKFPIEVCLVRGTDPHYLRIDVEGPQLVPPTRPGFMDGHGPQGSAGWGVVYREEGMSVWAYLTLPSPSAARQAPPWSRLAVCLPPNPTLN
ncbi:MULTISPECIES: hypothetical protein [Amycolatopsis]|uniref:Anti-sigma regulatory factor (Ser/Thr protein kinase) n=2 Tax=Amycolatopsis TaxID=1813 RepID=A0A1I3PT01_9PSEU|nr:hypothetical protein [Amycolatopsis sacchari]SFJ24555.1 hypothetical protein SAMN05421835_10431 [Amycolatopsis sacchari]